VDTIQSTHTEPSDAVAGAAVPGVAQPAVPSYPSVADPDSSEVRVVVRALWLKDPSTYEHCVRVSEYVGAVAGALGLPDFIRTRMRGAAFLHDIGKLCVSQPVLDADRVLNSLERTKVRSHAVLGYELLWVVPGLEGYAHSVRSHHERWDGTGYPDHLSGTQIPMTARLIAVADSFDVMTYGRNYAPSKSNLEIVKDLVRGAWRQFDPGAVRAFLQTWVDGRLPGVQTLDDEALALAQYALV
jgi:putative nucleotidyltransferase with HDIG domain